MLAASLFKAGKAPPILDERITNFRCSCPSRAELVGPVKPLSFRIFSTGSRNASQGASSRASRAAVCLQCPYRLPPAESAVACERPHTQTVCALCKPVTDNSRMAGKSTRDRIYSESTATWRMRPKEKQSFPRVPLQFWHKGFANLVPFKSRHKLSIGPPAARLHPMHDTS